MTVLAGFTRALSDLPAGTADAEVNIDTLETTVLTIRGGELASGKAEKRHRIYVRARSGSPGTTYTENPADDPVTLIRRAAENGSLAAVSGEPGAIGLPGVPGLHTLFLNGTGTYRIVSDHPADTIDAALAFGFAAEAAAADSESVERVIDCTVTIRSRSFHVLNSRGLDASFKRNWSDALLSLIMKRERRQVPGFGCFSGSSAREWDPGELARKAIRDGWLYDWGGLPAVSIPAGDYPAVLTGRTMRNIMMTAWRELAGTAMLTGESIFTTRKGENIGSQALNITHLPTHPMVGRGQPIDSEGTPCRPTRIVTSGLLETPLHTLESAGKDGRESTGSAGRIDRMTGSLPISLTTVPSILMLEPGSSTLEELIGRMGTGLLLTYSLDLFHSVNIASGEFSFPCGGIFFRNGTPEGFVSRITAAGSLRDLWSGIAAVGNDLDFDEFYLKSYVIGSPSVLAEKVHIEA